MLEGSSSNVVQLGRLGMPERLGDGLLQGVVYDILSSNGRRRGWTVYRTRAFGGGHLVIAVRGAEEIDAAAADLATAAIEVMAEIARRSGGGADVQLALPLELGA